MTVASLGSQAITATGTFLSHGLSGLVSGLGGVLRSAVRIVNPIGKTAPASSKLDRVLDYYKIVGKSAGKGVSVEAQAALVAARAAAVPLSWTVWFAGAVLFCCLCYPVRFTIKAVLTGFFRTIGVSTSWVRGDTAFQRFQALKSWQKGVLGIIVVPITIAAVAITYVCAVGEAMLMNFGMWIVLILMFVILGIMAAQPAAWVSVVNGLGIVAQDVTNLGIGLATYGAAGYNVARPLINAVNEGAFLTVTHSIAGFGELTGHPATLGDGLLRRRLKVHIDTRLEAEANLQVVAEVAPTIAVLILQVNELTRKIVGVVVSIIATFASSLPTILETVGYIVGKFVCFSTHPICGLQEIVNEAIIFLAGLVGGALNPFLALFNVAIPTTPDEIDRTLPEVLRRCGASSFKPRECKCQGGLFEPGVGVFRDMTSCSVDLTQGAICTNPSKDTYCQTLSNGAFSCGATYESGCPFVAAARSANRNERRLHAITGHDELESDGQCFYTCAHGRKMIHCPHVDAVRVAGECDGRPPPPSFRNSSRLLKETASRETLVFNLRKHLSDAQTSCSFDESATYDAVGAAIDLSCVGKRLAAKGKFKRSGRRLSESDSQVPLEVMDGAFGVARELVMRGRLMREVSEMDFTKWQKFQIVTGDTFNLNSSLLARAVERSAVATREFYERHVRFEEAHREIASRRRLNDFVTPDCLIPGTLTPGYRCPGGGCVDPVTKCNACPQVNWQEADATWSYVEHIEYGSWYAECYTEGFSVRSTIRSIEECRLNWKYDPATHPVLGEPGKEITCFPMMGASTFDVAPVSFSIREMAIEACGGSTTYSMACICPELCAAAFDFNQPWFGFLTADIGCWFANAFASIQYMVSFFTDKDSGFWFFSWIDLTWSSFFGFFQWPRWWVNLWSSELTAVCFAVGTGPYILFFAMLVMFALVLYQQRAVLVKSVERALELFQPPKEKKIVVATSKDADDEEAPEAEEVEMETAVEVPNESTDAKKPLLGDSSASFRKRNNTGGAGALE